MPSGASTGKFEAVELRDGEKGNYGGLSVHRAVENVNTRLAEAILGENALNQRFIDHKIIETDGTDNKNSVGANAALGVSMAVAWQRQQLCVSLCTSIWEDVIQDGCRFL